MKKLVMILGMASLFASGIAMADDHSVELEDDTAAAPANTGAAAPAAPAPAVTISHLYFNGQVNANTCSIKTNSQNWVITLKDIYSNSLKNQGDTGNPEDFFITLEHCPVKTDQGQTHVKLQFSKTDRVDPSTGNLNSYDLKNGAKNVQFQVLHNDKPVNFNQAEFKQALKSRSTGNEVTFNFQARYYATGEAEPGRLQSHIPFQIDYE